MFEVNIQEACSFLTEYFTEKMPTLKEVVNKVIDYCDAYDHSFDNNVYLLMFPSGKRYVGQTTDFETRMKHYKRNDGSNPHIINALKLYGFNNIIIEHCSLPTICANIVEIFMISWYNLRSSKLGYNKHPGGKSAWKITDKQRATLSMAKTGVPLSIEHRVALSVAKTGVPLSIEHRANISAALIGVPKSDEHRAAFSASMTEERRAAISATLIGVPKSDEHREALIAMMTDERRANISNSLLGVPKNEEHRMNMRGPKSQEHRMNMSGDKNHKSKRVVVNGKVFGSATEASKMTFPNRSERYVDGFIFKHPKSSDIFYITDKFYVHCKEHNVDNITKEMYDEFT
jgi:hypothetical protein